MTTFFNFIKRQPISCLLFILTIAGCTSPVKKPVRIYSQAYITRCHQQIDAGRDKIKNGDLIFRNGMDEISEAARGMNRRDSSWSHCGILFIENDSIVVYHSLGGAYNPDMKLLREPLALFCNPKENQAFGVYRYPLDTNQVINLQERVKQYYRKGLKFDLFFNFETDEVMYCTEFVFKSLNQTLNGKLTPYLRIDTIPYGVTTDDLFLLPGCRPVIREIFSQ